MEDLGLDDDLDPADISEDSPKSPYCLELDEWDQRKGQDLSRESERLAQLNLDDTAVADFHGCCFLPNVPLLSAEDVESQDRHHFIETMLESPDYAQLHELTQLDELSSSLATVHFAEKFAKLQKRPKENKEKGGDEIREQMRLLKAIGEAVEGATKEVQECKDAQAAFGLGPGSDGTNDPKRIAQLFKQVRQSRDLRRICELAGRYRRLAQSKQRQKTWHGYDDMVGVCVDGDVGRLLPHELVMLDDPIFSDDAFRRLAERQMMCREYQGTEPIARGPVLIVLDESGSMGGEKIHQAKALALALAWIAKKQNRRCALIAYSGDSGERILALAPGKWDEVALAHWLSKFIGHGSYLDLPLKELPQYYRDLGCPPGKTDVIMVTDAVVQLSEPVKQRFLEWKRCVGAKVISVIVGHYAGPLAEISDQVHEQAKLDVASDAVGAVLSV